MMKRHSGAILAGLLLASLASCDGMSTFRGAPPSPPSPPVSEAAAADTGFPPESAPLLDYYARVEQGLRTRGLLRADGGGPDAPFDADRLARTFEAVAFAREFTDVGPALVRREEASILHRWDIPVRIQPIFGAGVPEMQRADDRAAIARFAERLGRVTAHPVSFVERGGNFHVLVLTEEERLVSGPLLTRLIPGIRRQEIEVIQALDPSTYCVVVASDPVNDGVLARAAAVIRAELPPLLRLSCIHEEIAQGLGLANDSATARPSIFNDDDEFGRLTVMDEAMLGMLYDPRLAPGMERETATPVVGRMAEDLVGGAR